MTEELRDFLEPHSVVPPRRRGLIVGLTAAAGIVLVLAVATVIAFWGSVALVLTGVAVMGDPVGPAGVRPTSNPLLGCSAHCVTASKVEGFLASQAALDTVGGIHPTRTYHLVPDEPIGRYASDIQARFAAGNGTPADCAFALSTAPIAIGSPSDASLTDVTVDLGQYGTTTYISRVARVFVSENYARRYPSAVTQSLKRCPHYEVDLGGGRLYAADTAPIDFETVPSVFAAGWRETGGPVTITVVDLQYGNLVIRTILTQPDTPTISDEQFAAFILETSKEMIPLVD